MRHIIAVILVVTAGCGLAMTRGPDANRPPDQRPTCTESMAAPKRDAYGAVFGFVAILVGVLFVKADDNDVVGAPLIVGGAVVMAGSYASGGIGYYRVKKCRSAIRDFEQRHPAGPYAPQPYPPSPQPYPQPTSPQPYPQPTSPQPYPPQTSPPPP